MIRRNGVTKYLVQDKINFGKYAGEDLKFIYTFDPEYLEWLIWNVDYFYIEVSEFTKYHCIGIPQELIGWHNSVNANAQHLSVREYLTQYTNAMTLYNNPPENPKPFVFSKHCLLKLEAKKSKLKEVASF